MVKSLFEQTRRQIYFLLGSLVNRSMPNGKENLCKQVMMFYERVLQQLIKQILCFVCLDRGIVDNLDRYNLTQQTAVCTTIRVI